LRFSRPTFRTPTNQWSLNPRRNPDKKGKGALGSPQRTWTEKERAKPSPLLYRRFMKNGLLFIVALTLLSSSQAQTAEPSIQHLMNQQAADWNRGDVEAFMKGYEDAPTTTFVGDTVQYGYQNILNRYRTKYKTPAAMGKLTFTHLAIRTLDANYAVATGNFHLDRDAQGGGNADGIFSLVFQKETQGWKIILDHSHQTH
jgi:uncharacterized protein (TIGR02246 family)